MTEPLTIAEPWTDRSGHHWTVRIGWSYIDDRAVPVTFHLDPDDGQNQRQIDTDVLREVPLGRLCKSMRARMVRRFQEWEAEGHTAAEEISEWTAEWSSRPRTRPFSSEELAQVAAIYREAWALGSSPVVAVAERLNLPRSTAAKRVMKARQAGFLPPTDGRRAKA